MRIIVDSSLALCKNNFLVVLVRKASDCISTLSPDHWIDFKLFGRIFTPINVLMALQYLKFCRGGARA
jgi:intracellular septation protein A